MAWRTAGRSERDRPPGLPRGPRRGVSGPDPTAVRLGDPQPIGTGRRRALPAGRAVVGGFLVAVAAVIVFAASLAGAANPGQGWVVAARPLSAGTVLGPGDLTSATMRLSQGTATQAYRQAAAVEGRILAVAVPAGGLIQTPLLASADQAPALRPVSLAVDPVSLAGLSPGQPVDVLATQGTGTGTAVAVVLRGATLIAVAPSSTTLLSPGGSGQVTIGMTTLAEAEAVVQAAHSGTITLVAATRSDGVGPGPGPAGS